MEAYDGGWPEVREFHPDNVDCCSRARTLVGIDQPVSYSEIAEPTVTHSGVIHERWTFLDGSSVTLQHVFGEFSVQH